MSKWKTVPATERKQHPEWNGISRIERNESTGETRYRTHVVYVDDNGSRHQTETRVCGTPQECLREARKLLASKTGKITKDSMTIRQILETDFLPFLRSLAERTTTDATTGDINRYRNARALLAHYTPDAVADTMAMDITSSTFGTWISAINDTDLSGNSVRRYKTILVVFASYLQDHGYLPIDTDALIKQRMSTVRIKSRAQGARSDRTSPTVDDILRIIDYYRDLGFDSIANVSKMLLFITLFCTGVRVEELIALRVSSYDPISNTLTIDDAISDRESPENVRQRLSAGVKRMKNHCSARKITVMRFLNGLLQAYIVRYKSYFGSDNGYLFPKFTPGNESGWNTSKNILADLNKLQRRIGLDAGIDTQMFRHGCATFLIRDMGLGYDDVYAYFGHTSAEMLRSVYATLNIAEKQERANSAMAALLAPTEVVVDPDKQRRRNVMMLAGDYAAWMTDLIAEISE